VLASYTVAGGLGALAWDGNRKKIWAGWGGAGTSGDVRLIDPATGTGSVVFNAPDAGAIESLDDGLAYDAQDDSLLISPDTSTTIYHHTTGGASLGSFGWSGSGCYNSGVAIGGQLLFEGSDGCNHVWVVQRSNHAAFDFATGAGGVRDEDLECDSVTFSPKTVMWSMEAYEPRRAIAFEIPPGSCATGGGVDSDGDGLLDEWETNGVTIDPDGAGPIPPQFIDLPAMGADKNKPGHLPADRLDGRRHSQPEAERRRSQDGRRRVRGLAVHQPDRISRCQPAHRRGLVEHHELRDERDVGVAEPGQPARLRQQPGYLGRGRLRLERVPDSQGRQLHPDRAYADLPLRDRRAQLRLDHLVGHLPGHRRLRTSRTT
jgi:hypothetical protein